MPLRNSPKTTFVAHRVKRKFYKFKLFGINLISSNTCRDERFRNKFVFKKKRNKLKFSSKKRKKKKRKMKIQRSSKKNRLALSGTRYESCKFHKSFNLCRPQRQFAILPDDCFAVCCVPQEKGPASLLEEKRLESRET